MAEPTMGEVLTELAALRAEVRRLRRPPARWRIARRVVPLASATCLLALVPISLLAAPTFSDLNNAAEVHRANIQTIGALGIASGYEDATNPGQRLYDPKGIVTREEMASFLVRTAALSRVGRATSNAAVPLSSSPQTLATAILDAPGPGFAVVSGAGVFYATAGQTNAMASIRVRYADGGTASYPLYAVIGTVSPAALEQSLSPVWTFRLPEGGRKTFVIEALLDPASTGGVSVANVALTVLFVPFGSSNASAASVADPPAEPWPSHPAR